MRIEKTFRHQFGKVVERYIAFVKEHNAAQVVTRSTMLREPHQSKFKTIASLYLKEFWNRMNSPLWAEATDMPFVTVTRADLANLCGCSRRAVQDHLARLSHYGVIMLEEFDEGKVNGYHVAVNQWFLLGVEASKPQIQSWSEKVTSILKSSVGDSDSPTVWKSLPYLIDQKENLYNSYKAELVDKLPQERHQENCQEKQEIADFVATPQNLDQENAKKNTGAVDGAEDGLVVVSEVGDGTSDMEVADENQGGSSVEISSDERFEAYKKGNLHKLRYRNQPQQPKYREITLAEKNGIVENFWKYAKEAFYPNRNFSPIEPEIKKVIYQDVFGSFKSKDISEITYEYWQIYNLRMQYWVDKKQAFDARKDRQAYHPTSYFAKSYGNAKNQGFLVVLEWDKKCQKSLKEAEFERELEKAKMSMLQYPFLVPRGQRNKIKDVTQLAQYLGRKLTVRTNSEYVQKFNTFLTTTNFTKTWQQPHQQSNGS